MVNSHHRCTLLAFSAYVKQIARSLCCAQLKLDWSGAAVQLLLTTHCMLHPTLGLRAHAALPFMLISPVPRARTFDFKRAFRP